MVNCKRLIQQAINQLLTTRHLQRALQCSLFICLLQTANAATVTLDAVDDGHMAGPAFNKHFAGSMLTGFEGSAIFWYERRNYLIFDLSQITETITSAKLHILSSPPLPSNNFSGGYRSDRPQETFELHEVAMSADTLASIPNGQTGAVIEDVWEDLGDGNVFGSVVMTDADEPHPDGKDIIIDLNAAALLSLNNVTGTWAVGGILRSGGQADFNEDRLVDIIDLETWKTAFALDTTGDTDEDGDSDGADFLTWQREYTGPIVGNWQLFAGTGSLGNTGGMSLELETTSALATSTSVPEPSTMMLLILGSFGIGLCFQRQRSFRNIPQWPSSCTPRKLLCPVWIFCIASVLSLTYPLSSNAVTLETTAVHAMAGPALNVHSWSTYLTGFEGNAIFGYERRSYFTFDLTEITETIESASFLVWSPPPLPINNFTGGYRSDRPQETFELHEVLTPAATIEAIPFSQSNTPGVEEVWEDLGDGPVFGSVVMTEADEPLPDGKWITVTLNSAAIQSLNTAPGKWTLGGVVNPDAPSLQSDFDEDLDIDEADLAIWQNGFGTDSSGDADEDNDTDGADFLTWQRDFHPGFEAGNWQLFGGAAPYYHDPEFAAPFPKLELVTSPTPLQANGVAVPEPNSAILLFTAMFSLSAIYRSL